MNTGIWVDHRKAVLVSIEEGSTTVFRLESGAEHRTHSAGGWRAGGTYVAQCVSNEQRMDERQKHQLHTFYQEIIKAIGKAGEVYIFGPGEAKHELAAEIKKRKSPHAVIAAVEACDKMTDPQIAAKVKAFFKD